ncbi:MAG: endolytic transglycosylase MltG, partial [Bryobacteraceae bacterium]
VYSLGTPYRGFQGDIFLEFQRGSGTRTIAQSLADAGVIRHSWQLLLARAINPTAKLQAGEYRFAEPASVLDIFSRLRRGDIYYFDFTVPEGSNMFDIARLLEEERIIAAADFLRAAADPVRIHDLAPTAKTLEGYLFPSTYRLSHSTTGADLCQMMTAEFRQHWKKLAGPEANVHQTVTLASLVEKETGVPEERAVIAGVFANRMRIGMRLDCDPTVIYAALIENRYRGVIHRSDLDKQNPYNTYQNAGLPPGPIANPGAAALAAALAPAQTHFLYFVAKPGGGGHVFSSTLAAHEKAVRSYRHGATR